MASPEELGGEYGPYYGTDGANEDYAYEDYDDGQGEQDDTYAQEEQQYDTAPEGGEEQEGEQSGTGTSIPTDWERVEEMDTPQQYGGAYGSADPWAEGPQPGWFHPTPSRGVADS